MKLLFDPQHLASANKAVAQLRCEAILSWAHAQFGSKLVLGTGFGPNSSILWHMVATQCPDVEVVYIDVGDAENPSGIAHYAEELSDRFGLLVRVFDCGKPITETERELLRQGGDAAKPVLEVRKLTPMRRALKELGAKAILHGNRFDQSDFRSTFEHLRARDDGVLRIYPILRMSMQEAHDYIIRHDLPVHPDGMPGGRERECGFHGDGA